MKQPPATAQDKEKPNILLILADELRADALGCYGNAICRTPNLDRLAAQGACLEQCMITQPTCTPSRASILTGCFPSALRSRMVGCVTPDDPRFLPRVLRSAGYRTASIGKIHLVPQGEEPAHVERTRQSDGTLDYYGFEHVDLVNGHGMHCFGPAYNDWLTERVPDARARIATAPRLSPGVNAGKIATERWTLPPEVHAGEYIADRTSDYLRDAAARNEPFFLHLSFNDPHHPFTVPTPYAGMYRPEDMPPPLPPVSEAGGATKLQIGAFRGGATEFVDGRKADRLIGTPPADYKNIPVADWQGTKAVYYGMVSLLDAQIGRVLRTLDETGLSDGTLVVFASDHGEYLGDHGFCGKGFHYDSVIRTPLILRGPGIPAGQRIDGIASTVDLAPTLLDWASVPVPDTVQGISMRAALTDGKALPRDAALTENDDDFVPMRARTLTTRDWKITLYAGCDDGELYDRRHDPHELRNRWRDPQCFQIRQALLATLADHLICAVDGANGRIQHPARPVARFLPQPLPCDWCDLSAQAAAGLAEAPRAAGRPDKAPPPIGRHQATGSRSQNLRKPQL